MKSLLVILLLISCQSTTKHKEQPTLPIEPTKDELLKKKFELYLKEQPKGLDRYQWPTLKSPCDATGFLALCKTAGGCEMANFFDGEKSPGEWQRNAEWNCVETGRSKTSISKDMLMMGFVYGLYGMEKAKAIGYFNRLEEYGKENDWIMGYPSETIEDLSRVYMTPTMTLTLYNILQYLGVSKAPSEGYRRIPGGFQAHLRVLDILVKAKINNGIDAIQLADLKTLHDRDPQNALYQAVFHRFRDGDMTEVADILLDEKLFPSDRLPESRDRCESYLWQRDQGKDWQPCDEGLTHDAIDYLFVYWLAGFK